MKIEYLKLINYASIYTAMGVKEIEIDFSKCKNSVILFVGSNGSGKTSLLSALHPFAYYGNMDVRNNTSIILDGENGYKEIIINHNDTVYRISHYYKNSKKGIILKSFIAKNDEELNPNGNVTSFNEIVKLELSLEQDFLKLLRLGSNVTNLIDMKASERKNFTSIILSDIDIYNDFFDKINTDNRILKNMIKVVSDKMTKLNIKNEDIVFSDISDMETKINTLNTTKDNLLSQIGEINGKLSSIIPNGIDNLNNELLSLDNTLNDIDKNILLKTKKSVKIMKGIVISGSIEEEINRISDNIKQNETKININREILLLHRTKLNDLYNKKDELDNILKVSVSDSTYKNMIELVSSMTEKDIRLNKKFNNFKPIYTKDNLITILEILHQISRVSTEIQGFNNDAIKKVIELIKNGKSVSNYISERNHYIDSEILKITSDIKSRINNKSSTILFKPTNCVEKNCPYLVLYDAIFGNNDDSTMSDLKRLNNEKEVLENMESVFNNIEYIFMILKTNQNIIERCNIEYFRISNILSNINNGTPIFDEDTITDMISYIEEYDDYIKNKEKLKSLQVEIALMKSQNSSIDDKKKELSTIELEISSVSNEILKIEKDINYYNDKLDKYKCIYEDMIEYCNIEKDLTELRKNHDEIILKLDEKKKIIEDSKGLCANLKTLTDRLNTIKWEIDKSNDYLFEQKVKLRDYKLLENEMKLLNKKYEHISLIRESLSSNKGIPLLYMQLYLKNTKIFVNDLLKLVYSDNFEIDEFDINETEFNIPYIKNNIRISDVAYASQGEKSFLSLALSFALINQSIKDYNILLLDEIDSTLDIRNRTMFLNILEKQMDSINAEQVFLITHNNMFENYPIDLILTSKNVNINYTNANIIYSV